MHYLMKHAQHVLAFPFGERLQGRDVAQGPDGAGKPVGGAGLVVERVDRPLRDLGVDVPQAVEHLQQRALVLELVEFGELREFGDVHPSGALILSCYHFTPFAGT